MTLMQLICKIPVIREFRAQNELVKNNAIRVQKAHEEFVQSQRSFQNMLAEQMLKAMRVGDQRK